MSLLRTARPHLEPLEDRSLPATLSGVAYEDFNGNGLRDPSDSIIAGRVIFLDTNRNSRLDPGESSTVTSANGAYSFTGLAPGTYTVCQVVPNGWKPTSVEATALPTASAADQLIRLDRLRADPRFAGLDGRGFSVAVLDTGLDTSHPAFRGAVVYQYDFLNNDGVPEDTSGHGTHVASLIASRAAGYRGIAPRASLVGLKVLDDIGSGGFVKIEQGLRWVIDNAAKYGIVAVNLSLGDGGSYVAPEMLHGISDELAELSDLGVVVIAAAGNSFGPDAPVGVTYPAADANVLAVGAVWDSNRGEDWEWESGAIDQTTGPDRIASFSQRGLPSEVFAPGTMLLGASPGNRTANRTGSSMAAAVVAGLVPLVQQAAVENLGRRLTAPEIRDLIRESGAIIQDGDDEKDNVAHNGSFYRRVDALSLIERVVGAPPSVAPGPSPTSRLVNLANTASVSLGSRRIGSIGGVVFVDGNTNMAFDTGEWGLANRVVFIDRNMNGRLDTGELTAQTSTTGRYQFLNILPGAYQIRLQPLPGQVASPSTRVIIVDNESIRLDYPLVTINEAPILLGDGQSMQIQEDSPASNGMTVQEILGETYFDSDGPTRKGIAVIAQTGAINGAWEYSLDGGTSWTAIGSVSPSAGRLLRGTDRIRFVPRKDFSGKAGLEYRAWDQTSGSAGQLASITTAGGGSSPYSSRLGQTICTVMEVNDAPVYTGADLLPFNIGPIMAPVAVASFLKDNVRDPDSRSMGIAAVGSAGLGRWQFSQDGINWTNLGLLSPRKSRLLGPNDMLRFVPFNSWQGSPTLTFRAWDLSAGKSGDITDTTLTGGTTPYSINRSVASLSVKRIA